MHADARHGLCLEPEESNPLCQHYLHDSTFNIIIREPKFLPCLVLLSCLVSELKEISSSELKPRIGFRRICLYFFTLLSETDTRDFKTFFYPLRFRDTKPSSPGIECGSEILLSTYSAPFLFFKTRSVLLSGTNRFGILLN